jgi:hypothetical protein
MPSPNFVTNSKSKWSISSLYMSVLHSYLSNYIRFDVLGYTRVTMKQASSTPILKRLGNLFKMVP